MQPKDDKQAAAAGGVVTGPTMAIVGEPTTPEPVTPIVAGDLLVADTHTPTPAELADMLEIGGRPTISDDEAVQQIIQSFHNSDGPISRPAIRPRRVYIAHPLRGGKLQDNINKATAICSKYAQRSDIIPMSPIHAFCFVDPMTFNQTRGMEMCFALLASCDELWVHGEWWTSEGCLAEICWASMRGIPVRFMTVHPVVAAS